MRAPWVARPPRSPPALHRRQRSIARSARSQRGRFNTRGQPAGGTARRRVGAGTPGFGGRADSRVLAAWAGPARAGKGTVSRAVSGWASAPVAHAHASIATVRARIEPDLRACVASRSAWDRVHYRMADKVTTDAVSAGDAIPSYDAVTGYSRGTHRAGMQGRPYHRTMPVK